jgi:hypothetical protein
VIPAGKDSKAGFRHFIDQAMLLVDTTGPAAGELVFQRLWISQALKGVSLNGLDQLDDLQGLPPVLLDPPAQVLESGGIKL